MVIYDFGLPRATSCARNDKIAKSFNDKVANSCNDTHPQTPSAREGAFFFG
ncbi:hypothetical protein [Helicobacter sp. T3_23-1056]